jgi:Dynamin GTPase effector domain
LDVIQDHSMPAVVSVKAFGEVDVGHLRSHADVAEQAFDMRMRLTAYWKSIKLRLVDCVALHILHRIKGMVEHELESEMINELWDQR